MSYLSEKTICCIQARINSTRLYGKVMLEIIGKPIIQLIIERLQLCSTFNKIILLTSVNKENDVLEKFVLSLNIPVVRGSEEDVLSRFVEAQKKYNARHIIRICADNPLLDPTEVDKIVTYHFEHDSDYSFNHVPLMGNDYPDGIGAEIFTKKALLKCEKCGNLPEDREHVNNYIFRNTGFFIIQTIKAPKQIAYPTLKLDVDTIDDFFFVESIFNNFDHNNFSTLDVINFLRNEQLI